MTRLSVPIVLLACATSCDFDAAFRRYCENNTQCVRDAGWGPETVAGPDAGPEAGPDAGPEAGPDAGPDAGPESGPEAVPDLPFGPEAGGNDLWPGRDRDGPWNYPQLPRPCGRDNDCGPNEVCHPFAQVCLRTCKTRDECTRGGLDTCAQILDPGGNPRTPQVCQCTSAQSCSAFANGFTCNTFEGLCEPTCSSAQDCQNYQPPRGCDTVNGVCQALSTTCSSNRECFMAAQPRCDTSVFRCVGCVANSDCSNRPDGLTVCSPTGACVP